MNDMKYYGASGFSMVQVGLVVFIWLRTILEVH